MARERKPYQRGDSYKSGDPDAGTWKHDLHPSSKPSSLASRIGGSSRGGSSLLDRISGGQGRELITSGPSSSPQLYGFGDTPPANPNNVNAGLELLPGGARVEGGIGAMRNKRGAQNRGRLVESGMNAALGLNNPRRSTVRPLVQGGGMQVDDGPGRVSIMGAARGTVWVRVENLAAGTTGEDVMSAFAPAPVLSSRIGSSSSSGVTVEIEVETRDAAQGLVKQYDGVVADGNALRVTIVKQNLADRLGSSKPAPASAERNGAPRELVPTTSSGKMYSDTILRSDPSASIITLASDSPAAQAARANAWKKSAPSFAERIGGRRS